MPNFRTCLFSVLTFAALAATISVPVYAQALRYIDESGNIFFVDKLDDIPYRYRYQVIGTPTANPVLPNRQNLYGARPSPTPYRVRRQIPQRRPFQARPHGPGVFSKQTLHVAGASSSISPTMAPLPWDRMNNSQIQKSPSEPTALPQPPLVESNPQTPGADQAADFADQAPGEDRAPIFPTLVLPPNYPGGHGPANSPSN